MARFDLTLAGESNLDLIMYGLPPELEPEREHVGSDFRVTLGGSSGILAHNLGMLGAKVGFITAFGNDLFAAEVKQRLSSAGVDLARAVNVNMATGVTVLLPHERFRHMFTFLGTISAIRMEDLDLEYLGSTRHFHLSSFFLHQFSDNIPDLFRQMKAKGISTSLDTNDDPEDRWKGKLEEALNYVDVLLPNDREAMKISKKDDLESALEWLTARVPTVVVKRGPAGSMAVSKGERYVAEPVDVKVVDPVGAGDSFNAGFLSQYLQGSNIGECLRFANRFAAMSTTAVGGTEAFREREAVRKMVKGWRESEEVHSPVSRDQRT